MFDEILNNKKALKFIARNGRMPDEFIAKLISTGNNKPVSAHTVYRTYADSYKHKNKYYNLIVNTNNECLVELAPLLAKRVLIGEK